jgi:RNA polymerase sigma-70 factor (sigma-E family)
VALDAEQAFTEYVHMRIASWSRVAYLLTGDRHLAEDLVQVTFERVARHWARVSAAGDPDPYVRRIMYRQHVSQWRRRWRGVELRAEVPQRADRDATADAELAIVVRRALARLTTRQRAVLVLRFFCDLTEVATADVLHCSVSTVKSTTRESLARLRALAPDLVDLIEMPQRELR